MARPVESVMARRVGACAGWLAALLLACVSPASPAAEARADDPTATARVVAFADVHGSYDDLAALLRRAGVIDGTDHWSAGRTRLVSLGDLLDRGADSRRVLDLLMRLQDEARKAGGAVDVVLGNHEAMNLLGDLRYVSPGEYAAFAAEESATERARHREDWLATHGAESGAQFEQRFPPGYFAHADAFAPNGRYGRWLLARPVVVAIDGTLFMHGGPSALLQGMSLDEINLRYRSALVEYLAALAGVEEAGLVRDGDPYAQRAPIAAQRLSQRPEPDQALQMRLAGAVQRFAAAAANPMLRTSGPNWYRGAALCAEATEADVLQPLLEGLGARRLVLGHTTTDDGRVASRFDGRVVKLDTGMNRAVYHGHPAALVIEGGTLSVVYADDAGAPASIAPEGLRVAPLEVPDATVADTMAAGAITVTGPRAPGTLNVVVDRNGAKLPGVFVVADAASVRREVAAYRLDRLLQLGLVPATAAREVQGQTGYVQARPAQWSTQADLTQGVPRDGGWCALEPQLGLLLALDGLLGNEGRTTARVVFDTDEWRVLATDHARAFGTAGVLPAAVSSVPWSPGPELLRRLRALDAATLQAALGDLLDEDARRAILLRRDALIATQRPAATGS